MTNTTATAYADVRITRFVSSADAETLDQIGAVIEVSSSDGITEIPAGKIGSLRVSVQCEFAPGTDLADVNFVQLLPRIETPDSISLFAQHEPRWGTSGWCSLYYDYDVLLTQPLRAPRLARLVPGTVPQLRDVLTHYACALEFSAL